MAEGFEMPVSSAHHLIELAHEFGFASSSWAELDSWLSVSGASVNRWEKNAIIRMVKVYSSSYAEFNNTNLPSPTEFGVDQDAVADQVRAAMRG